MLWWDTLGCVSLQAWGTWYTCKLANDKVNTITPSYTALTSLRGFHVRGASFELVPVCQKQGINPSCMLYPVLYWLDSLRRLSVSAPNTPMLNWTVREKSRLCVCVLCMNEWVMNLICQRYLLVFEVYSKCNFYQVILSSRVSKRKKKITVTKHK